MLKMLGRKMGIGIFGNKYKFFVLVVLLGLCNYAESKCFKCDTFTTPNCGLAQSSETADCVDDTLGCYLMLYNVPLDTEVEEPQTPGLYTKRGCVEDLTDSEKAACPSSLCEICTTDGCNDKSFPTNRGTCMKCQGSECGTDAEVSTMCSVHLETQNCISLFDEDGVIQHKNCYSDVVDETRNICDDVNQLDCSKCVGNDCNIDTQQRGLKCFKCSGLTCFEPEDPSDVVGCVAPGCYVGLNANGENVRDCSSAITDISKCGAKESDNVDCIVCRDPLCNGVEFPSITRQVCQVCLGDACQVIGETKTCAIALSSEGCVTVFDITENNVIERGCSSSLVNQQVCTDNSERCRQCSTAGCNTDNDFTKTYHCIACNSLTDSSCNQSPIIPTSCATDSCYSKIALVTGSESRYTIARGCSVDNTETCVEPNCLNCVGENCNNQKFPTNRLTCLKCVEEECLLDKIPEEICNIHDPNHLSCITVYSQESEAIYRDCIADAVEGTRLYCEDDTQLSCTKCSGDSCNKDTTRRGNMCVKCSGISCFNTDVSSDSIECLSPCYVGVNANGEMVRDCASNIATSNQCSSINSGQTDCLICVGDFCNAVLFPKNNRLQCKTCQGAAECDLVLSESSLCPIYSSTERCVSVFDRTVDQVVERGCASSLSTLSVATCAVDGPNCVQCAFNDCNVETSKGKTFHCYECDSTTDPLCILKPTSLTTCATSGCFSTLLEGTAVGRPMRRGCLENIQVCSSPNCLSCTEDYCNTGVFPTDRLKCLSCANDGCLSSTIPEKMCQLYNKVNQNCITFYSEDSAVIYRDCYADAANGTRQICDDNSEIGCTTCSGNSCNRDVIRRGNKCIKCAGLACFNPDIPADVVNCLSGCYVGVNAAGLNVRDCSSAISDNALCGTTDNGQSKCLTCEGDLCNSIAFPLTGRLQCQTCLGAENCVPDDANIQYCQSFNVNEACVSIFDADLNQVNERGCSSNVRNKQLCDSNNVNCKKCTGNNCNLDTSKILTNRCISCSSALDPLCVSNPTKWTQCATNQCFSRVLNPSNNNIGHHIERGCLANLVGDCTDANCKICQGTNCNNAKFPVDRLSCLKCTNEGCQMDQVQAKQCVLYNGRYQGCITFFNEMGQVKYRDCFADAPQNTRTICDDEKQLGCTKCTSNFCNTIKTRRGNRCLKCNGLDCFTPNVPADLIDCLSGCYIGLNIRGETVRDCAASVLNSGTCGSSDNGNNTCLVCSGDGCNAIDFPLANRLSCYSCLGDECFDSTNEAICPRMHPDERCATVFDISTDAPIERGCASKLNNQRICDENDPRCVKCTTKTCNTDVSRVSKICASCSSSMDPNCVRNPLLVPQKMCTKGCYTKITGEILTRGCEEELTTDCNTSSCQLCSTGDRCNVQNFPATRLSCNTCVGSSCLIHTPQLCINSRVEDRCATIFSGYNVAKRGCLSDQNPADALKCTSSSSDCTHCPTANCNTALVRSDEKCITCDSRSDARCSQKPLEVPTQMCSASGNGVCFTRTVESGATLRGCAATLTPAQLTSCKDGIGGVCSLCTGESCNFAIQPSGHLKCYTCSSLTDPDCAKHQAENTNLLPCRNQISGDECVEITQNTTLIRGCLSDFPNICANDSQGCSRCKGEGCNKNLSTIIQLNIACLLISLLIVFKNMWRN